MRVLGLTALVLAFAAVAFAVYGLATDHVFAAGLAAACLPPLLVEAWVWGRR